MANALEKFKRWRLKKMSQTVNIPRSYIPMKHAGRLAVLYDASDSKSEKVLKHVAKFCEENHLRLTSFGYFDDKELNTHLIPHSNADFFCNKHLDFLKLPHKSEFLRFTSEKFDYLINLYPTTCLPLLGISALSEAKFRVGPYWPEYDFCFDLMFQSDTDDLLQFTDDILIYLKNFGNGQV